MTPAWKIDETKILSRDEVAAVLVDLKRKAKRSANTRQNLVIFRLATCCGLRVSEICGQRLGDLKLSIRRPYIQIRKAIAKGRRARRVPLWWDAGTLADLESWKMKRQQQAAQADDPFVCTLEAGNAGKPLIRQAVRMRFKAACRVLGPERVKELTIHHGRHSFVSHALAGGRSAGRGQGRRGSQQREHHLRLHPRGGGR